VFSDELRNHNHALYQDATTLLQKVISAMTPLWNKLRLNWATTLMLVVCLMLGMMSYVATAQEIEIEVR
jgi:hypothetical protein